MSDHDSFYWATTPSLMSLVYYLSNEPLQPLQWGPTTFLISHYNLSNEPLHPL
jgi:hypothetical protein